MKSQYELLREVAESWIKRTDPAMCPSIINFDEDTQKTVVEVLVAHLNRHGVIVLQPHPEGKEAAELAFEIVQRSGNGYPWECARKNAWREAIDAVLSAFAPKSEPAKPDMAALPHRLPFAYQRYRIGDKVYKFEQACFHSEEICVELFNEADPDDWILQPLAKWLEGDYQLVEGE